MGFVKDFWDLLKNELLCFFDEFTVTVNKLTRLIAPFKS